MTMTRCEMTTKNSHSIFLYDLSTILLILLCPTLPINSANNKFAGVGGGSLMDWQHIAKHVNQSLHEEETNFILHFTNNNFDLHDKDRTNKQLRKSMMTMGTNNGQF